MATLSEMMVRLGLDASGFSGPLNSAQSSLNTFASSAMKAGSVLTGALTVPIAAIGVGASKAFIDFDAAMTQSLAIMGDLSKAMRDDMAQAARQMALESTFSAKQVADSYFFLASAGLDAEASIKALPVVTKFAQAGMFDMALATDLLTDAQSALGLTIRDDAVANMQNMIKVSDVLVKANVLANASVQQFSEALTAKAGAALKILNKDIEEGVAVLAAFADQGIKGSEAGDKLNIVLRDLQTASIKNRGTFEAFGITVFDAQGKMRNMADIIKDLERVLGPMSDEQKRATLMMLGFQDRSVAATLQLVGYSDQIRKYEAALREAGGTTEDVANRQLQTFSAQLTILKNRVTDSGIAIGSALVPMLSRLMDLMGPLLSVVESLARGFTSLDPTIQVVIVGLAAIVAAIGPLLVAAGGLAWSVAQLIPLFGATATASGLATTGIMGIAKAVPIAAAAYAGWKLGEWLQSFTTEYKDAEKKVLALSDSLKAQGVVIERGGKSLKDWAAEVFKASEALEAKTKVTGKAEKAETEFEKAQRKSRKETDKLSKSVKDAAKETAKYEKELKDWKTAAERASKAAGEHWAELHKVRAALTQAREQTALFEQGLVRVGNETVDYIHEAYRLRDSIASIENAARNVKDIMPPFSQAINDAIGLSTPQVNKLGDAMKTLGLDSIAAKQTIATEMAVARDAVLGSGVATDFEKQTAIYRALKAQIEAAKEAGTAIPAEQMTLLNKLEVDLKLNLPSKVEGPWKNTMTQVSTAMTNAVQSMVGILIGTESGTVADAFKKLGQGILSSLVEPALGYINDLIEKGIKKLIGWLIGEVGLTAALGKVGTALSSALGIGGGVAEAAGGVAGAAGGVAGGVAGGAGGVAGAAGQAAGMGVSAAVGMVTGVVSAVSGVISNFQFAAMNKSLDLIETEVRYSKIYLQTLVDIAWTIHDWIVNIHTVLWEHMHTRLEEIRDHLNRIELFSIPDLTSLIRDSVVPPLNMMATAGGPVVNVYVTLDGKQLTATVATEIVDTLRSGGQQL